MKQFTCGDVVPGCEAAFSADSEDEILEAVANHASRDHGMEDVPESVVEAVRASIVTI